MSIAVTRLRGLWTRTRRARRWLLLLAAAVLAVLTVMALRTCMAIPDALRRFRTEDKIAVFLGEFGAAMDGGGSVDAIVERARVRYMARTGEEWPTDAWGRRMHVDASVSGEYCTIRLFSSGRDGAFATGDDISQGTRYVCHPDIIWQGEKPARPTSAPTGPP